MINRNHLIYSIMVAICCSCNDANETKTERISLETKAPAQDTKERLPYPALYTDWEIGNRDNLTIVLNMYKDWDEVSINKMEDFFADSVTLDMPDGVRTSGFKDEVIKKMEKFRSAYTYTKNEVLNAIPLRNPETNFDWVRVMVYNKWIYKDNNKRDSALYYDIWRLKDGKINYLLSFEQSPSRMQVKQLERLAGDLKN